jgi:hypothetical protein
MKMVLRRSNLLYPAGASSGQNELQQKISVNHPSPLPGSSLSKQLWYLLKRVAPEWGKQQRSAGTGWGLDKVLNRPVALSRFLNISSF